MQKQGWLILGALFLLLFPSVAFSQYGPMGIGNKGGTSTPAGSQPRLLLWLDGSSSAQQTNNGLVTTWTDKSGNNHNFTATGNNRPTFLSTGGPAGTPCLSFDGVENRLVCSNFEFPSSGYSIYFIIKSSDNKYGMFSYATGSDPHEINIYNDNGFQQEMGPNTRASAIGNISTGIWNYGGIWWDNTSNVLWEYNRSNAASGEGSSTFANGFSISPSGTAVLGDIQNSVNGGYVAGDSFQGEIAEIIIWDGVLSKPFGRLMRTYIYNKYGNADGNNSDWDKFQSHSAGSAGEYYTPIGVGRDGSAHYESRLNGLVLRLPSAGAGSYMCAGQVPDAGNSAILSSVTGVAQQWKREWEISGVGGNVVYQIGFDFGEGITNGKYPQNIDNYVLLRKQGIAGTYSIFSDNPAERSIINDEVVFSINRSVLASSNYYFTLGTKNADESSLTGEAIQTWYAYQSGNWDDPYTWTLDGSAAPSYVNPTADFPKTSDKVYIGSGRTVTVNIDGVNLGTGTLKVFGILDVAAASTPVFGSIAGSGLIRCKGNGGSGNFPTGTSTAFANPINGGTVEFYGDGGFTQATNMVVNKLKVNFSNSAASMTLAANLTHNGMFEVNTGTFIVNDNSDAIRTITSNANVLVEDQGRIKVSESILKKKHIWNFEKDLINNGGEIWFTNRNTPDYVSNEETDYLEARFISNSENQELRANGLSYFSRIVLNKGVDMTYLLSISSISLDNFKLLGKCNSQIGQDQDSWSEISNLNSCALVNGTLEVGQNIFIPLNTGSGNYNLPKSVMLWVNGGEVAKGAPEVGPGNSTAIVVYGMIKVSDGILKANCNSGLTTRQNGLIQIDGGEIVANQIRTSVLGTENIGGIIINGGEVNVNGTLPGGTNGSYYTFSLTYPGNLFQMTGGELNVTGPTSSGLIFINSDPQNTSVSGGVVNLDISNTSARYYISSRAAFWNLNLTRSFTPGTNNFKVIGGNSGNGAEEADIANQDLIIRNNLKIIGPNKPRLEMATSSIDLYLYGNMEIGDGCVYNHNNNTTHFVGSSSSFLTFEGSTTFPFYNVDVNKDFDSKFVKIQDSGPTTAMDILGSLNLEKGYFINNTKNVEVKGKVTNRTQFGDDLSTGYLRMNGNSGQQNIISDGGVFYKLMLDNSSGVTLKNDGVTIKSWLQLQQGSFFIDDYKLRMETTDANPIQSFNNSDKFIVCSGNASAGGIEILNNVAGQHLTFPFGVNSSLGQKYTPADIYINPGWVDDGFIRVTPVDTLLSTSNLLGTADYLNYYWRVTSSDYSTAPKVTHVFTYDDLDIRGTIANFRSGRVLSSLPFTRGIDNSPATPHVDATSHSIYYNGIDVAQNINGTGTLLVDADYSAGAADRFAGSPEVFFSRSTTVGATWETPGNWNKLSECTGCTKVYDYHNTTKTASMTDFPEKGDIAVIGFDVNSGGKPHVYKAPAGANQPAQILFTPLQETNGTRRKRYKGLTVPDDLGILRPTLQIANTSQIINVTQISGEGELWITGDIELGVTDIGGFLSEDSSVVVIYNANNDATITNFLPVNIPNLFIAVGSPQITSDIRVRGNLEVGGTSRLYLSETLKGNIEIDGDLILNQYQSSSSQAQVLFNKRGTLKTVNVHGDVKLLGSKANIGVNSLAGAPVVPIPWTPTEVGALLWLDATNGVTTSGGMVTQWDNMVPGGSSFNAAQGNTTYQPAYNVTGLNGHPTIQFDGSDDFLSIPHDNALNITAGQDFEIFTVLKQDNSSSYRAVYAKGEVAPTDFLLYMVSNKYKLYVDHTGIDMTAPTSVGTNGNMGWGRRQGQSSFLYNTIGGNKSASNTASATNLGNTYDVTIGAAKNGLIYKRFFSGDIAEIILIKHALTEDDRDRMEGYLAHKWGLQANLPTGHPYKDDIPYIGGNGNQPAQLIVGGDIIQKFTSTNATDNGLVLYKITPKTYSYSGDTAFVNLIVTGAGTNEYKNLNNSIIAPKLWKLKVDKGTSTVSSFTFNTDVDIDGPANEPEKPVNIQNGLLKFNNPNIDITLSSGGGDFVIPASGGLELDAGNLKITGNETGILLTGSLKIHGGSLSIGEAEGENNYIEYASSGTPKLSITGGSLTVGSQIRRGLSSTAGSLDYLQSGGIVTIGKFGAPATKRGMLEVTNSGKFEHTGGTLIFVRGLSLGSTPSLLLNTTNSSVSDPAEIIIGNSDSPSGVQIKNFGINSNVSLNKLTIDNASGKDPVVRLITNKLELNGKLTIDQGASLMCKDRNLILHGDVTNNGLLSSTSGLVTLDHPVTGLVNGLGVFDFFNLERKGGSSGTTQVSIDLLVKHNFTSDGGVFDCGSNTLIVKGDVIADGELKFDTGSDGLMFNGDVEQHLDRSSTGGTTKISTITIDNSKGVTMTNGAAYTFVLDEKLRLSKGVFNLKGNLLELGLLADIEEVNSFGENNMISTGGAFTNFGVLKNIPAGFDNELYIPLGIDKYMPISLDFGQPGYSSGSTNSSYLFKLNAQIHPIIIDDAEVPPINDFHNVLGMYFSMDATNVGNNLKMDAHFYYDDTYVNVTAPYTEENYYAARVYDGDVLKLDSTAVNEVDNVINFSFNNVGASSISGDYFAGVDDAIPNLIPKYHTNTSGNVDGDTYVEQNDGAPYGADVYVEGTDVLTLNVDGVNFYRTFISPGATVLVNATTRHRLGKVSGSGTIHMVGTGNLPSGEYTNFFKCDSGRVVFEGLNGDDFSILSNLPVVREVKIIGSTNSDITIADNDVNICTDLTVNGPRVSAANSAKLTIDGNLNISKGDVNLRQGTTLIKGNLETIGGASGGSVHSGNTGKATIEGNLILGGKSFGLGTVYRETHVEGDISKTSGTITEGTGGAKLVFDGIVPQTITGTFTGTSKIPFIEMNNGTGLTLNGNVDISDTLKLTDGNIFTSAVNMLKLTLDGTDVDPAGGQPNSFVDGPMQWYLLSSTSKRIFPVGNDDRFRPLFLDARSANRTWEVEYYDTIALVHTQVTSMDLDMTNVPQIETVSVQEHWRVNSNSGDGTNAKVGLSWGDNSVVSTDNNDQSKLLVLAYGYPKVNVWNSFGGNVINYDDQTNRGSLVSTSLVHFTERFLTLGSIDAINPLPVTWLYFKGENKVEDNVLTWATASEKDNDYFELERSLDAHNWTAIAQITAAGHSTSKQTYNYTDQDAPFGRVYYRLKQVDFDSKKDYAPNVVSLERSFSKESEVFDFLLYPNPSQIGTVRFRMLNISDVRASVSISDMSGKLLSQNYAEIDGQGTSSSVDCNFEPGVYLVTVIVNDKMRSKPLVITK